MLSSYVLISLVLTSFPWKGPKRAPLGMLHLSVKTPRCETFPHDVWRTINPEIQRQNKCQPCHGGFTSTELNVGEDDAVGSSYLLEVQVFLCRVGECENQQLKMEKIGKLIKTRFLNPL